MASERVAAGERLVRVIASCRDDRVSLAHGAAEATYPFRHVLISSAAAATRMVAVP
jgi:hypothetical protein